MKRLFSLILVVIMIMSSNISVFARQDDINTMSKEQISKIAEFYLREFIAEELETSLKTTSINQNDDIMIELYDVNDNIIAYLIPLSSKGFMIVDARENGYGLLETSLSAERLEDILEKDKEGKLYYLFPSRIFLDNDLKEYFEENSINKEDIRPLTTPKNSYNFDELDKVGIMAEHDVVELTNEADFVNISGIYYGGDQDWFDDEFNQDRGCGTVAAANITAHMADYVDGCSDLYRYSSLSRTNFKRHMDEMLEYVTPTIFGTPTLSYFARGVERFADDNGVILEAVRGDETLSLRTLSNYIKDGLRFDSPVAHLQYYNPVVPRLNWHWVTITKYFQNGVHGDRHIAVSNWGERESYSLDALYDNSYLGGVVYFNVWM